MSQDNPQIDPTEHVKIGIAPDKIKRIAEILNQALSDQHVLYIKTRNFHWNLVGKRFHTLHLFLEQLYKELETTIDETAERLRSVGGVPHASMAEYLKSASLKEASSGLVHCDEAIERLLADHQSIIQFLRKSIHELDEKLDDAGTADFLTGVMEAHEKTAWMLRSHLE